MEQAMSLFSTIRAADRSRLHCERSVEDPRPPLSEQVEAQLSLPRHLLLALAGITADVTSLRERCGDAPELQAPLAAILGRLDGLVDSIYQRAADPTAPSVHRSGLAAGSLSAAGSPSDALADVPADFASVTIVARPPTRVERPLPGHPS